MNETALRRVAAGEAKSLTHMPFTMDKGIAHRAAIGLIVLATDQTVEHEFRKMLAIDGVAFYETRIHNAADINPTTLAAMEKGMAASAGVILPGCKLDVVAYGCTSGTVVIGEEKVFARIREARPDIACTTPITGAIAGFKALGAKRIALLTPYIEEVNQMLRRFIEARGVEVPVMGSFNHENDTEVARISQDSIKHAVRKLVTVDKVDAVFVSCTSLRVATIAEEMEREVGLPVTSSNHAMAWHCLRLAGYQEPVPGFGRLFRV
ncbi:MAG TPA: aspartate/glutamate racemase family protein [Dongiaceae bacterium]|jgi:maleate isomerase|nr:aspartate/glutamate racemase family protein [Dongiaceae bacterium]